MDVRRTTVPRFYSFHKIFSLWFKAFVSSCRNLSRPPRVISLSRCALCLQLRCLLYWSMWLLSVCLPRLVSSFPFWYSKNGIRRGRRNKVACSWKKEVERRPWQAMGMYLTFKKGDLEAHRIFIVLRNLQTICPARAIVHEVLPTPARPYSPSSGPGQAQTTMFSQPRLFCISVSFSVE